MWNLYANSNPNNFGLEWSFMIFSVLKMIALSLAIWWAHQFLGLICAWGSCLKTVLYLITAALYPVLGRHPLPVLRSFYRLPIVPIPFFLIGLVSLVLWLGLWLDWDLHSGLSIQTFSFTGIFAVDRQLALSSAVRREQEQLGLAPTQLQFS